MAHINPYIEAYTPKDYAGTDTSHCKVDCSLGVNYWHLPQGVMDRLKGMEEEKVKHYPHGLDVLDMLIKRYEKSGKFERENFCLGCGSFDLLCNLNLLYANANKKIMGHAPQFSAYVDNVHCIGAKYVSYPFDAQKNYAFDPEMFIWTILAEKPDLVCCENPNNPTGQKLPTDQIENIIRTARDVDAAIVFDEAYGDYLTPEESAVRFVPKYDHVFVTRTFSKGFGMAGMRMGYVLGPKHPISQLKKLVTPFNCNELGRQLAMAVLSLKEDYLADLLAYTQKCNERLYGEIRNMKHIKRAETCMTTPICMLYVEDKTVDLCEHLNKNGIATVSGLSYDNLGQNAVRMMLCEDQDTLIELLWAADRSLG